MDVRKLSLASHQSAGSTYQICRICHAEMPYDAEAMVSPCHCAGSLKYVHQECLQQWIKSSNAKSCEICKFQYSMHTKTRPFRQWERLELDRNEKRRLYMSLIFQTLALFCIGWSIYLIADRGTYDSPKPPNTTNDAAYNGPPYASSRAQTSLSFNAIVGTSPSTSGGTTTTLLLLPSNNNNDGSSTAGSTDSSSSATFNWPFWARLSIFALGFAGGFGFMYIQLRMYLSMCRKWQAYNKLIYVRNCPDRNPLPVSSSSSRALTQAQANIHQQSQSLGSLQPSKPFGIATIPPFSHPSLANEHFLFEHGSHHVSPSVAIISSTAAQLATNVNDQLSASPLSTSANAAVAGGGGGNVLMLTTTSGRHIPGAVVPPNMMMMGDHHQPSSTVITISPGTSNTGVALQTTAGGAQSSNVDSYYSALTVYHHHHLATLTSPQQQQQQPPPLQLLAATPLLVQQPTYTGVPIAASSNNQVVNVSTDVGANGGITLIGAVQDNNNSSTEGEPALSNGFDNKNVLIENHQPVVTAPTTTQAAAAHAVCYHHHHHHYCHHHHNHHENEQQAAEHAVIVIAPENSTTSASTSDGGAGHSASDCFDIMFSNSSSRAGEPFVHVHAVTTES